MNGLLPHHRMPQRLEAALLAAQIGTSGTRALPGSPNIKSSSAELPSICLDNM